MRVRSSCPAPRTSASPAAPAASGATRRLRRASWSAALAGLLVAGLATAGVAAPDELTEVTSFVVPGGKYTGSAVDFDGDYAIFSGTRTAADGSVVIAHRTGAGALDWDETTLVAPAGVTNFGVGVGIDAASGRAVVSALHTPAVFVYTLAEDGSWTGPERVDVTAPLSGRNTYGNVGERLDLDGGRVVVTAPNAQVGTYNDAGAAYVLDLGSREWSTYVSSAPRAYGIFGQAVAIEGTTLVASELQVNGSFPTWPVPGTYRLGRVQVFDTSAPAQQSVVIDYPSTEKTRPAGPSSTMPFGVSLAVDEGRVYVGAPEEYNFIGEDHLSLEDGGNGQSVRDGSTTQGAVYVFDAASGAQLGGKITAPAGSFNFGARVEVDGDALLASAYNLRPEEYGKGEVYVYDLADVAFGAPDATPLNRQAPAPAQMLRPADAPDAGLFGLGGSGEGGIVVSGTTAVVGSPYLGATGTVTVFEPILPVVDRGLTVSDTAVVYGEQATVVATTDTDGDDGGEVVFTVDGVTSAPVVVDGHVASLVLDVAAHDVGSYDVTASFAPTTGPTVEATATHTVTPASTAVHATLTAETSNRAVAADAAQTVLVSGTVTTQHGTLATGAVELWDGGTLLASAPLDAADAFSAAIPAGTSERIVTVRYPGDLNHLASVTAVDDSGATVDPLPETPGPETPGLETPGPEVPAPGTPSVPAAPAEQTADRPAEPEGFDALATTGATVAGAVAAAMVLLLAGVCAVAATRVRRREG